MCLDKIISASDTAPPAIRDQAQAFRSHLEKVILEYMKQAIKHDRVTIYNAIKDAGYDKLAEHIIENIMAFSGNALCHSFKKSY